MKYASAAFFVAGFLFVAIALMDGQQLNTSHVVESPSTGSVFAGGTTQNPNVTFSIATSPYTTQGIFQITPPKGEFSSGASLMFAPIGNNNAASISGYSEPWDRLVAFYVRSYEKNPKDTEEILIALKISIRFPDGRTVGYSKP